MKRPKVLLFNLSGIGCCSTSETVAQSNSHHVWQILVGQRRLRSKSGRQSEALLDQSLSQRNFVLYATEWYPFFRL